jgi:hypothetical protein
MTTLDLVRAREPGRSDQGQVSDALIAACS